MGLIIQHRDKAISALIQASLHREPQCSHLASDDDVQSVCLGWGGMVWGGVG